MHGGINLVPSVADNEVREMPRGLGKRAERVGSAQARGASVRSRRQQEHSSSEGWRSFPTRPPVTHLAHGSMSAFDTHALMRPTNVGSVSTTNNEEP